MNNLKITTINIHGLHDKKKRQILTNWLKKDFDIVCLKATYVTKEILLDIERDFPDLGKFYSSCSESSHGRGVGVLISSNLHNWKKMNVHKDDQGV